MQVSVEKTSNLGRRLTIQVPADVVQNEESVCLKDFSKNAKIEGFRPGKVPANYIKQKYAKQIRQEAVSKVLQSTLDSVLEEQKLRPANRPNVEDLQDKTGENLVYTVSFDVFPEIALQDFSTFELTKRVAEISDAEVQDGIKKLQEQFAAYTDTDADYAAQTGDELTIDFVGELDGVAFEGGTANGQKLEIGSGRFIPGFEEGLLGAKAGEQRTIDVTFPAEYHAKNLAGKATKFKITVHKIRHKELAEINADFADRIGIEDKDVSKVADYVRNNMLKYVEEMNKGYMRNQAIEQLYVKHNLELPESLLEQETHELLHEQKGGHEHGHGQACKHDDVSAEEMAELKKKAHKRLAVGLLINEIVDKNKLEPDQKRMMEKMNSIAMMYGGRQAEVWKMFQDSQQFRSYVRNMVLSDQAADLIVANATIKEVVEKFDDIVNAKAE